MSIPNLRQYQLDGIAKVKAAFESGSNAVLAVYPTGAGKTTIGSEMVRRAHAGGRKIIWLAHRSELVDQAYDRLREFGLKVGVISASSSRPPNPYEHVQVASIQTLLARGLRPEANLLIWDEAHHAPSDLWSGLAKDYAQAKLVGFTATPERSDGRGLGAIYTRIVVGARVRELVASGHLVPCDIRRPASILRPGTIAQRPVDAYTKQAAGRRSIVFSPSVMAAEIHMAEFLAAGISAELIHGETPMGERMASLDRYRMGTTRILVNVFVLTEGFDAPETSCVILARGCGTAGTYLQMVGRGLRPAAGKTDCILIDLHGVSHIHGHPEDDRVFSLDGKGIRNGTDIEVDPQASCRVCGAPVESGQACLECGTEARVIEAPKVTGDALVKYAAKRAEGEDKRAETAARWIREAADKGYKTNYWKVKYKAVYGDWPSPVVESAAHVLVKGAAA